MSYNDKLQSELEALTGEMYRRTLRMKRQKERAQFEHSIRVMLIEFGELKEKVREYLNEQYGKVGSSKMFCDRMGSGGD